MAYKPYAEKLKDPRWQKKRLEVMGAAKFKCQLCDDDKSTLSVHHPKYIAGKEPWDYDNLICLCEKCHEKHHGKSSEEPKASLPEFKRTCDPVFSTAIGIVHEMVLAGNTVDEISKASQMLALAAGYRCSDAHLHSQEDYKILTKKWVNELHFSISQRSISEKLRELEKQIASAETSEKSIRLIGERAELSKSARSISHVFEIEEDVLR